MVVHEASRPLDSNLFPSHRAMHVARAHLSLSCRNGQSSHTKEIFTPLSVRSIAHGRYRSASNRVAWACNSADIKAARSPSPSPCPFSRYATRARRTRSPQLVAQPSDMHRFQTSAATKKQIPNPCPTLQHTPATRDNVRRD